MKSACAIDDHAQSVTYQSIAADNQNTRLWTVPAVDPTFGAFIRMNCKQASASR